MGDTPPSASSLPLAEAPALRVPASGREGGGREGGAALVAAAVRLARPAPATKGKCPAGPGHACGELRLCLEGRTGVAAALLLAEQVGLDAVPLKPRPLLAGEAEVRAWAGLVLATQLGQLLARLLEAGDLEAAASLLRDCLFLAGDGGLHGKEVSLRLAGSDLAGAVGQMRRWERRGLGVRQHETVGISAPNPAPAAESRATYHTQGTTIASGAAAGCRHAVVGVVCMPACAPGGAACLPSSSLRAPLYCLRAPWPPPADARPLVDGLEALLGVLPGQDKIETWLFPTIGLLRELGALLSGRLVGLGRSRVGGIGSGGQRWGARPCAFEPHPPSSYAS